MQLKKLFPIVAAAALVPTLGLAQDEALSAERVNSEMVFIMKTRCCS